MTHGTIRALTLLALAALLALSACTSTGSSNSGKAGSGSSDGSIEGVEWQVVSSSEQDFTGFGMTATFEDGTVAGKGAVNSYSAPCVLNADGSMEVGDVTSTLMAGSDEANAAEAAYFELLKSMVAYELKGDELVLFDGDHTELVLKR